MKTTIVLAVLLAASPAFAQSDHHKAHNCGSPHCMAMGPLTRPGTHAQSNHRKAPNCGSPHCMAMGPLR
jgi:hypothetical protein